MSAVTVVFVSLIIVVFLSVCVFLSQDASHRVSSSVFHMFRYYTFGRMRKSADYFLLLSNSKYITWWSTVLSLLIVTSGYLQLLFLKRLFITKTCTEAEKPRCWRTQICVQTAESVRGCWCCVCVRCNTLHTITTQNSLSSSTEQHMCDFFIQH